MILVLVLHIFELLSSVAQDNNCGCNLLSQLMKLLISLFNLFIESLVLNLELLEINQVQTISQLLLLLQNLLLIGKPVTQGDVLEAELSDFLILLEL